jgi:chloride channel protein, CIC family
VRVLVLRRSIVTEKLARRGVHAARECSLDAREAIFVRDITPPAAVTLEPAQRAAAIHAAFAEDADARRQRPYPVPGSGGRPVGVVPWSAIIAAQEGPDTRIGEVLQRAARRGLSG